MPFCPACGNASSEEARFCMKCGRELGPPPIPGQPPLPPTAPPTNAQPIASAQPTATAEQPFGPPAAGPPVYAPPAYAPPPYAPTGYVPVPQGGPQGVPQGPSPAGLFLRRTVSGDWTGALKAGLWPTAVLLAFAGVLATQSSQQIGALGLDYGGRLRLFLATVLQGVGGILGFTVMPGDSGSSYGGDYDPSTAAPVLGSSAHETGSVSVVPLVVTVLWGLALVLALRHLRRTQTGAEAAIRVAAVCTAGAVILALVAQPSFTADTRRSYGSGDRVDITSGPLTVLLWTFVLSLVVGLFVLCRDRLDGPLATSPGVAAATRALRAALLALGIGVAVCAAVVLIVLGYHSDELDATSWLGYALLIVNAGVSALGLAWGVPAEAGRSGSSDASQRFGLSDLGQFGDGWAVPGALAAGVVCALILGVVAVRRCADRREQWLAAGFHVVLFVLLIAVGGVRVEYAEGSRSATVEAASSVPEALLFGLLWAFGGVLAVTFIRIVRAGGQIGAPAHSPAYPPGYAPQGYAQAGYAPPGYAPPGYAQEQPKDAPSAGGYGEPELLLHFNAPPETSGTSGTAGMAGTAGKPAPAARNRLLVIGLIMLGAFAIGGAAAAGVIMYNRHDDKPAEPAPSSSAPATSGDDGAPSDEPSPSEEPTPSDSATSDPFAGPSGPSGVPTGVPTDIPSDVD